MLKAVIILGAGPEQVDAYKTSNKKKIVTIGVDKNKKAIGVKFSRIHINKSIYAYDAIISCLKKILKQKNLNIVGIIAVGVDCPKTLYKLSSYLDLKTLTQNTFKKIGSKDKLYKNSSFKKIVPKFRIVSNFSNIIDFIKKEKFPVIFKPRDDRGARNVYHIKNKDEFENLMFSKKDLILKKKFIIQKFIPGKQLSVECLIVKKSNYLKLISTRNYDSFKFLHPNVIENGGTFDPKINKVLDKKINFLIDKIVKNIKLEKGPLKLDLIVHKNKIYLLEIAIRFGGGYVASRISKFLTGQNFLTNYIDILNDDIKKKTDIKKFKKCVVTRTVIASDAGILKNIKNKNSKDLKRSILFMEFNNKIGDFVRPPTSHTERVAFFAVGSKERKKTEKLADKIANNIKLKII